MKNSIFALGLIFSTINLSAQTKADKVMDFLIQTSAAINKTQQQQPQTQQQAPQQRKPKAWFEAKSSINFNMRSSFPSSDNVYRYLMLNPFLKDVESFIEKTLTLDAPLYIIFVDNDDTKFNAHFDPSCNCIRISYSIIKQNADKVMLNFRGTSYTQAVQGVTLQILFHEMGHYLVHNYQLNITGKEENAVDELSVMSMLFLANEKPEYYKSIFAGILGWYDTDANVSSRSMVDVHAPSRERYYDMLSLYLGAMGYNNAKSTDFVGNKEYQLDLQRLANSEKEYQKAYKSWTELMSRFL